MALLKSIAIFTFFISIAVASNFPIKRAPNVGHDLTVGSRLPGDRIIHKEYIIKNGKWFQIVEVTKTFSATRGDKITQIKADDQITDGTGAYAKVISGGPLYNNVTMKFTSQRGYGINFLLEIYAR